PCELAADARDAMEVLLRDFGVELLLATQRDCVVFNRHFELILPHVGEFSLQYELMLAVAVNVDRWHPRAAGDVFLRTDVEALEHPAHSLLQRGHIAGRIPANNSHDDSPVLITWYRGDTAPSISRNRHKTPTESAMTGSFGEGCCSGSGRIPRRGT